MAFIGKNTIENLTTAMYEDLRIIYREYIQNAADSIDHAITSGLIEADEAIVEVDIDKAKKYVSVRDNGTGIKAVNFEKIMGSIADSTKDRSEDKGFRGIGRLGGISSCKKLVFSCSFQGENIESICEWDAQLVKDILVDQTKNPSAEALVDMATKYTQKPCDADEHFFKVELIDVDDSSSDVLDERSVKEYLRSVAPVPYAVGFIFASKIHDYAKENGFRIDEYHVYVNGESLCKDYTTKIYEAHNNSKKGIDELFDVEFRQFTDDAGNILAWMWFGISTYDKQIPSINKMRGIRLRKGNIQIGNENTFTSHDFYKEPRGGLYFVGEVFAIHPGLIPNARRDYFNLNNTCRDFEEALRPLFFDRFYQIYHYANGYKKALQKQNEATSARKTFTQKDTSGSFISKEEKSESEKKVIELEEAAQKAAKTQELREEKEGSDDVLGKVYGRLKNKYQAQPPKKESSAAASGKKSTANSDKKPNKDQFLSQKLTKYNKKEQKLISKIYAILTAILPHDTAAIVINKIQEELSK